MLVQEIKNEIRKPFSKVIEKDSCVPARRKRNGTQNNQWLTAEVIKNFKFNKSGK